MGKCFSKKQPFFSMNFREKFIKKIYGDHNDSRAVKCSLNQLIEALPKDFQGLNVGAGNSDLGERFQNLELFEGEAVDLVGSVENIPSDPEQYDVVVAQEVIEHVADPTTALAEISRVLKPGGMVYLQVPFMIGYHPCPNDYWRFTEQGLLILLKRGGFLPEASGQTVGSATGFYRIAVEFFAILFSLPWRKLYIPFKAFFALALYPLKWLDFLFRLSPETHRISGGYFVIGRKPSL